MFVQTEVTPNPNSLKFLPGKKVSNSGPYEITSKEDSENVLVRNILAVNGVEGIFLGEDFISVNKNDLTKWEKERIKAGSFLVERSRELGKYLSKKDDDNLIMPEVINVLEDTAISLNDIKNFNASKEVKNG